MLVELTLPPAVMFNVPTPFSLSSGLLTTPTTGWQTPTPLETSSTAAAQLVASRSTAGTVIAAWVQGNTVFARVYNPTTQLWSTASTLSGTTAAVTNLRVYVDAASGNATVTWISAGNEVRVNRYVSSAWAGNELMAIWNQMDNGTVKEDQGFEQADQAVRKRNASAEKEL